jgi:spore maturation protein CgeB
MSLNIVVFGLSITSSWGNGHATTYRALLKALAKRGHVVTFLERDVPWYREHRDVTQVPYCRIELYEALTDVPRRYGRQVAEADLVILGSYVPDGAALADWITMTAKGVTAFYDIDTPVTLAALADGGAEYIRAKTIPRFDLYLSFTGGPALETIEGMYGSPRARTL